MYKQVVIQKTVISSKYRVSQAMEVKTFRYISVKKLRRRSTLDSIVKEDTTAFQTQGF